MSAALALLSLLSMWDLFPPLHQLFQALCAQELTTWEKVSGTILCIASGMFLPVSIWLIERKPNTKATYEHMRALEAAE